VLAKVPGHPGAHHGCGLLLLAQNRTRDALDHLGKAVKAAPGRPLYRFNHGLALSRAGQTDAAIDAYRQAVRLKADFADAWNNLGLLLGEAPRQAEDAFTAAVAANPGHVAARINLARLQCAARRRSDAAATLAPVLTMDSPPAEAWFLQGTIEEDEQRFDAAIACYRRALERDGAMRSARNNIGTAQLGLRQYAQAHTTFHTMFAERRGPLHSDPGVFDPSLVRGGPETSLRTCRARLVDAAEQLRHMIGMGLLEPSWEDAAGFYDAGAAELDLRGLDPAKPQVLDGEAAQAIAGMHEHAVRFADVDIEGGAAIGAGNDWRAIEEGFLASPTSITAIDGFLSPQAHEALQRFCRESTIFFGHNATGYVTSYMADGFACSLLYRIAEELQALMPTVLGGRHLHNMWVYRYGAEGNGVEAHTDDAAVTFNFWIGPEDASLDPDHGGLVLFAKEQPLDWDWTDINLRKNAPDVKTRIGAFLSDAEQVTVAHRPNRAVLFGSNMFHRSDRFAFRQGFGNRRTNVTLLFGERGA
jgi:tetratricopeptide (TPR) repeat protein